MTGQPESPAPTPSVPSATVTGPAEGDDAAAYARHLIAAAEAADTAYRLAAARVVVYEFLHQYGRSDLPAFRVALDLAGSLRKVIDNLGDEEERGPTIAVAAPAVTAPAPAPAGRPATATGPAGGAEAALGRVAALAESWAALVIPGMSGDDVAAEADAHCGRRLLDFIHGPSSADVRLSRVTALAEAWMAPGGPALFYPAAGQAVLDAIRGASTEEAAGWRERAERAEAKLAEVRQCCQEAARIADLITGSGGRPIKASPLIDAILAIIGTGEDVRGGAYDVWGADFGIVGGKA